MSATWSRVALVGALVACLGWATVPAARAAGPMHVNGAGTPLVWAVNPIPYNPDQGLLGALGNATAVSNVTTSFAVWAAVPTASIGFTNAGAMPVDVTTANYTSYVGVCDDGLDPIVFDTDGSITDDLFGPGSRNSVLGFAGPDCMSDLAGVITEGSAVLNGRWIDGVDTPTNPELSPADFNAVLVHEFGHYVNLDHSQVNLLEGTDVDQGNDAAVATMFPLFVNGAAQGTLNLDDRVSVSMLYPAPSFGSLNGRITGTVLRANGTTPFLGASVIARMVGDPRDTAVGVPSGARYFPANPGGPPPPGLQGLFEIPGLPPGSYTVEIEGIDGSFTGGSSIGPLTPPVALPGLPEFWNGASEASTNPPDDPTVATPVNVFAGATSSGINFVMNAVPPATNDTCASATVVNPAPLPFHAIIDTTAATRASSDPLQSCSFRGPGQNWNSVWFRFTAPQAGTVWIDTAGSSYDTLVTLYTGTCGAFTEVACNDDQAETLQSALSFIATGGTTYLVEVTQFGVAGGGTLDFTLNFFPGCGDGVVNPGEACDDGAANGTNGCCTVTCTVQDTDLDGVCDRDDNCPATSNVSQADGDADGIGDACDLCLTLIPAQTTWQRAKLSAFRVGDGVPGNDRVKLRGQFGLATGGFTVDPLTYGARIELRSGTGFPRLSVTLPTGPFVPPGPGWLRNANGSSYLFRDLNPGGTEGILKMMVNDLGGGQVRVTVVAKHGSYPMIPTDAPLAATVVLGPAPSTSGECGELTFPTGQCIGNATKNKIVCR